jgi:MEDS: MEthanogen/methylotroph, DcmR Sensory domain
MSGPLNDIDAIAPGDHICAIQTSLRRDDVLLPFLRDGLDAGHKCVAALTEELNDLQRQRLGSQADVQRWLASGQLELRAAHATVTTPATSSITTMIDFWERAQAPDPDSDGYECTRLAVEAGWWLPQLSNITQMLSFESILNRLSAQHSAATLCLYDVSTIDGALLMDLIRTHPRLVIEAEPVHNPAYLPPEYFDE